jgi:hypothetical protein
LDTRDAIRLLLGVARLGEADLAAWWNTQVLAPAGQYVLPRTFPRTWRPAAGELLLLSASRWHEGAFDNRPTALHLFSQGLPFRGWVSSWLAEQKTVSPPDELFAELGSWRSREEAYGALQEWTAGDEATRGEHVAGHLRLEAVSADDLANPQRLDPLCRTLAAAYLRSLETVALPYYDLTQ